MQTLLGANQLQKMLAVMARALVRSSDVNITYDIVFLTLLVCVSTKSKWLCYLNGISESKVGGQLQMTQSHASDRAGTIALLQPALNADSVIGVTSGNHDRVIHELH